MILSVLEFDFSDLDWAVFEGEFVANFATDKVPIVGVFVAPNRHALSLPPHPAPPWRHPAPSRRRPGRHPLEAELLNSNDIQNESEVSNPLFFQVNRKSVRKKREATTSLRG